MEKKGLMRKITAMVLSVLMFMTAMPQFSALAAREYAAELKINGLAVDFKNEAYSRSDIIYVPLEELCGYLNLQFTKDGDKYKITRMGRTMTVTAGNLVVNVDGMEAELPTHPEEKNGVLYVPAELFSQGFGCPLEISEDMRSVSLIPNVYKVPITENTAAAISAGTPDKDTLATGTSADDNIFYNVTNFPQMEKSLFYLVDLTSFKGKELESVKLALNLDRGEYGPTLRIMRTAPWKKGELTYNTQPVLYEKEYVNVNLPETTYTDKEYDITSLAALADKAGEVLSVKLLGMPHSSKMTSTKTSFMIRGVNHIKAPYVLVSVKENYSFPIKAEVKESADDEARYSEFELLRSLGVFTENDEFPLDLTEGVQRQEFVKYALRLRNASVQESVGEQFFSDVPADAPFYKEVMTAHSMGLVSGWQGIAFRPYDNITLGEAITILGRMLNYNIFADERGGFTPGYFAAARNGDLYNGAEIEKEALSFKKMFKLLEDALDAKMLNVRSYSSNGTAEYTFDENKTILTEYWNAQVIEGTVTANEYSSIDSTRFGKEGKIAIDGKELSFTFKPYNEFLGYSVKAYYDRYEDKLLYMGIKEYDITEIDISDITGKSKSGNTINFTYEKENGSLGSESFSFEKDKKHIIYNGKAITEAQFNNKGVALLDADAGSIKLVGDSLTVITAYRTVVVSSVNAPEEEVYDLYDAYSRSLELKGKEYTITDVKGEELSVEKIGKNDVISVAQSLDNTLITAIVSKTKITGAIETIENAGTADAAYTINGKEYELCNTAKVSGKADYWTNNLDLGFNTTFFLNHEGRIAGTAAKKTEGIIGYLLTMGYKGSAISKKLQAAVVIKDAEEYVVYDLADKVEVDCIKYTNHEDIETYFTDNALIKKQPIIFDLNAEGKIKKINTPEIGKDQTGKEVESRDENLEHRHTSADEGMNYKSSGIYGGKFFLGQGDGVIIARAGNELEDYFPKTSLPNNKAYNMDIWTIGKKSPKAVVALVDDTSTPEVHEDSLLYVVDRVVTAFDSDGMEVKKLYYYSEPDSRKSVVVNSKYEHLVSDFARGDIIRFGTNAKDELEAATKYFDYDTHTLSTRVGGYNELNRVSGGYVGRIEETFIQLVDCDAADIGNPQEEKRTDISDYEYTWHDSSRFTNLMSYEVSSSGIIVKKETIDAIRTYEDVPYNPNGLILNAAWESIRANVWILDMKQPANTGRYILDYNPNTTETTYESVRCNNDGSVTVSSTEPTRAGHAFKYWVNEADQNKYYPGDTFTLTANTVLTAEWVETPTYTVTLRHTGAGISKDISFAPKTWDKINEELKETKYKIPTAQEAKEKGFSKDGWQLVGWEGYSIGQEISVAGNIAIDAIMIRNWSGTAATEAPELVDSYYQIETGEDLAWFSEQIATTPNLKAKLVNDIYLNNFTNCGDGKEINETGANWFENVDVTDTAKVNKWNDFMINNFAGEFDGNGKTIYGLYLKGDTGTGFFSSVAGGTVKNVTFKGAYLQSMTHSAKTQGNYSSLHQKQTGLLAARVSGTAQISKVTMYGKIVPLSSEYDIYTTAAVAGNVTGSATFKECVSYVTIDSSITTEHATTGSGNYGVGAIIGTTRGAGDTDVVTLEKCINHGTITTPHCKKTAAVVGVAGHNGKTVFIECGNDATITVLGKSEEKLVYWDYGTLYNGTTSIGTNQNGVINVLK
ncbi:MAG: S-layer homology domain-containing protein [Clostridia bacterium]|nr:S-layer homology domain-containing protein [Clostridia bacterium]